MGEISALPSIASRSRTSVSASWTARPPVLAAVGEQSAEIGASLEAAVVNLQCHDRLAQRVGHICAGLDSLHTAAADGVERPNQEWLRLLREVERRQHAEQARLAAVDIAPRGSVELLRSMSTFTPRTSWNPVAACRSNPRNPEDVQIRLRPGGFRCPARPHQENVTGISLAASKLELVYGRISAPPPSSEAAHLWDYRRMLESDEPELIEFCNAMTTNLTSFFRESHHFDYLRDHVLRPKLGQPEASRRIRIWSAACLSGEEPYSIAMTVREAIPDFKRWDIRILATDIDSQIRRRRAAACIRRSASRPSASGACASTFNRWRAILGTTGSRLTSRHWSPSNSSTWFSRCR